MRPVKQFLVGCGGAFGILLVLAAAGFVLVSHGMMPGLLFFLLVGLFYGWMLFAFFHYRRGRQEEFLHLLATAVEAEVPLAPALAAYLEDRPHGLEREAWVMALLFFVFPGYYWVWHRRHSFDRKVGKVAYLLDLGVPLQDALRAAPGVVPRDALLAVAIGQATGKLAPCLRSAGTGQLATLWLQVGARLLYPFLLLLFVTGITGFWMTYILPRMQRIFRDFDEPLPEVTSRLVEAWGVFEEYGWLVGPGLLGLLGLIGLLIFSSTLRWYLPGLGRLYRMYVQGRVLKMLALLLEAGKPVPEALGVLAECGYFTRVVRRHLHAARRLVEQGESLATSLRRKRLLPAAMSPLVQAAQRVQNVPWVLAELGESRANRALRLLQRLSMAMAPFPVVAVGVMVGFIALAMFTPLIDLIWRLGE